jgi:ribonuclease BN (tRNA processing enzyme)
VPVDRWPGTDTPARPRLIAPEGAKETFRRVVGAWGREELIEEAFEVEELKPGATVRIGPLEARLHEVPHFTTTFAINFTSSNGGGQFTYGADCRPGDELVEVARGTDLLFVEATLPRPERTGERGHMTPGEAGDHARRAGARRVVLTHISDELDELWAREQGARTFNGPVEVAHEGAVYVI